MKNLKTVFPKADGSWHWIEKMPEEPVQKDFYRDITNIKLWEEDDMKYFNAVKEFKAALKQAQDTATLIAEKDWGKVKWECYCKEGKQYDGEFSWSHWKPKPLKLYELDVEFEVNFKHTEDCRIECRCDIDSPKVAHLVEPKQTMKEDNEEMDLNTKLNSINGLVQQAIKNVFIKNIGSGSLTESKIRNAFPEMDIIASLEKILTPKYENDVFTWKQIKDALYKDILH